MIKRMPWWLKAFTGKGYWVTIYPHVYTDENPVDYPQIVTHENVHLHQQRTYGKWKWLWRYITNKSFRLDQEAEAIVLELAQLEEPYRHNRHTFYCKALSSKTYFWCARTVEHAALAIYLKSGHNRFGL